MTDPKDAQIPEEILRSERKQAAPTRPANPGSLGLPGLSPNILDTLVKYAPILVLASGLFGLFNALSSFDGPSKLSAILGLAASTAMLLEYSLLKQRRRLGWDILALAWVVQFLGQILLTGVGSILFSGIEVLLAAYVMLQLRDSYSN